MLHELTQRDADSVSAYFAENDSVVKKPFASFVVLLRLLWSQPLRLLAGIFLLLISAATTLVQPRVIGYLVDEGLLAHDLQQVFFFISVFTVLECVRITSIIFQGIVISQFGQDVMHKLRVDLVRHVLHVQAKVLDSVSTGQIVSRITGDIAAIGQLFSVEIVSIVEKLLVVSGILFALVWISPELALYTLVLFPLMITLGILLSVFSYRFNRAVRASSACSSAFITDSLRNPLASRFFNLRDIQIRRYNIINSRLCADLIKPLYINAIFHPAITLINAVSIVLVMYFGSSMVEEGKLSIGVLATFISYVLWLFWPVIHIVNQWSSLSSGLASVERVSEVFGWKLENQVKSEDPNKIFDPELYPEKVGEITFDGVWFHYSLHVPTQQLGTPQDEPQWALKNVTFTIKPGQKVGIVGLTGSGKSTLLSLLFKLYEPQRGEIRINGIPLKLWPNDVLRKYIGLLQQDGTLFEGTVKENIAISGPIDAVEGLGELSRFSVDSSRDISQLSSGERQWVLFARAFARSPKLWILDEAAAHLDPYLDELLHLTINNHAATSTYLVVAHRLSAVATLDLVLVLHHGELVEQGSPLELSQKGGLYSRLLQLQTV
jgi:ATP-binding cassette subfamily B multidrug efflux pump